MEKNTAYQMCIVNMAQFIKSDENKKNLDKGEGMNAFQASEVLSIAFCKSKEKIVLDIVNHYELEKNI